MRSSLAERPTARYRFYDTDSRALYIGIAANPEMRWGSYPLLGWWPQVDHSKTRVDWYGNRAEAATAEVEAIAAERPAHNRKHADYREPEPTTNAETADGHLTSDDAAARLGITRRTLYNLADSRPDFPKPQHIGRTVLWPVVGLDEWRAKHPARKKKAKGPKPE